MSELKSSSSKIKNFFQGEVENRAIIALILVFSIGYATCLIIARIFYPTFTMTRMFISAMGDPQDNPIGYIPWSIGHVIVGITMIPMVGYLKNKLSSLDEKSIRWATIFFYIACIGVLGLGAIPQYPGDFFTIIHGVNAGLLIGGIHFGLWLTTITLIKNKTLRTQSGVIFGLSLVGICGLIITQLIVLLTVGFDGYFPFYLDLHFWEWIMMCFFFGAFLLLVFAVSQGI